jgi:carboxymethylenebutenolidase
MQTSFYDGSKNIRVECHEPSRGSKRVPAIILAHGSGGETSFWIDRLAPYLNSAGVALYAPHYFDKTNTVRADLATITDGIHVPQWLTTLSAALDWVAARPAVDPSRIALVGVSLGSFLSLGLAAQRSNSPEATVRNSIRCLVDISGGLVDPYAAQATRDFPPTLIVHGEVDSVVPIELARRLDSLLSKLQVSHNTTLLPGEDHWFSSAAQLTLLFTITNFLRQYL